MFPSEIIILLARAVLSNSGPALNRPMDVMSEYVEYLYNSLAWRGYLKSTDSNGFKLTSLGEEELSKLMNDNRSRAVDVMKALQQLGIETINKMEELRIGVTNTR